jgi:hypothetical protein
LSRYLQKQRGLSYTWVAPDQDDRTRHGATPEDPVEFRATGSTPGLKVVLDPRETGSFEDSAGDGYCPPLLDE